MKLKIFKNQANTDFNYSDLYKTLKGPKGIIIDWYNNQLTTYKR